MEDEIWKQCDESKMCYYYASNKGRIKSVFKINKKETILKPAEDTAGYLSLNINYKTIKVHTYIAYTFIGERPKGLVIDHIDRCKTNNHIENLRYISQKQNIINSVHYRDDISETDSKKRYKIFQKEYDEKNKEIISNKKKEKYTCECGSIISKWHIARHEKSKKHLKKKKNLV